MSLRILQVVSQMDRAGIETWLMHVLRQIDRNRYQFDFMVHGEGQGDYDDEILSLGSRILRCDPIQRLWSYAGSIRRLLEVGPPYDIVHVNRDYFSGIPLRAAAQAGVPVRIAHSHNDLRASYSRLRLPVRMVAKISRALVPRFATHGLAASEIAAETLYGREWKSDSRWRVLPCGLDLTGLIPRPKSCSLRAEFGIPTDAVVIGHVGRFSEQKNHRKLLEIASELRRLDQPFRLVLVGQGPLRPEVESEAARRDLTPYVLFAGVRDDVPRLFSEVFDVFLFPSRFEGLGLAIIEALAAGCPAVISDTIPREADVVTSLISRVPLEAPSELWASAVLQAVRTAPSHGMRLEAHQQVLNSPYNVKTCIARLTAFYDLAISETLRVGQHKTAG